jgi:hypothetical protein
MPQALASAYKGMYNMSHSPPKNVYGPIGAENASDPATTPATTVTVTPATAPAAIPPTTTPSPEVDVPVMPMSPNEDYQDYQEYPEYGINAFSLSPQYATDQPLVLTIRISHHDANTICIFFLVFIVVLLMRKHN